MTFEEVRYKCLKFINLARSTDQWRNDEVFRKKSEIQKFLTDKKNEGIVENLKVKPADQELSR